MSSLNQDREYYEAIARERSLEYVYECQQCGKWNISPVCMTDDEQEQGCGEKVHIKRIRRWR
jgi:hypothetical protein